MHLGHAKNLIFNTTKNVILTGAINYRNLYRQARYIITYSNYLGTILYYHRFDLFPWAMEQNLKMPWNSEKKFKNESKTRQN